MPLYLISRPRTPEGEALRNHAGLNAALVSAASPAAAITAANALAAARGVNAAFSTGCRLRPPRRGRRGRSRRPRPQPAGRWAQTCAGRLAARTTMSSKRHARCCGGC